MKHRGGHPAQVIGSRGPAFEGSGGGSNLPEPYVDWIPCIHDDGQQHGWIDPDGNWHLEKPNLPPRNGRGRFVR